MSGFFRVQNTLPLDDLTSQNDVINVLHFDSDQSFEDDADDVATRVGVFYESIAPAVFHSRMFGAVFLKVYDLADPEPRPPRHETSFTFTPNANAGVVPGEIAAALSYKADPVAGIPAGRLRGRIYIGHLQAGCLQNDVGGARVSVATRAELTESGLALATGPDPGDGRLAVFSERIAGPAPWSEAELDAAFHDVAELWCDDEPDVIRRRGRPSSARTTVLVP